MKRDFSMDWRGCAACIPCVCGWGFTHFCSPVSGVPQIDVSPQTRGWDPCPRQSAPAVIRSIIYDSGGRVAGFQPMNSLYPTSVIGFK